MPAPVHHRVVADPTTGAPVLVKRATDPAGRARLAAEHALLRRMGHLGVVRPVGLTDAGVATELHLAWVGPHSLATVTGVPAEGAAALVARVAETVAGLHAEGMVHRAVRPDHVLLAADGWPILTGLAHAAPAGTPDAGGPPAAPADDVEALGRLLVGLVNPVDTGAVVPERRRRGRDPGTRGVLLTLADRATADDPAARPTAAALAADLWSLAPRRRASGPLPHPAPAAGRVPRAPREAAADPRRRPPALAGRGRVAAAAVLVGLVGTTAAGAAWLVPDHDPAPDRATGPTTTPPRPATTGASDPSRTTSSTPATALPPSSTSSAPASTAPPVAPTTEPCPPAAEPAADVDGDGCREAVRIDGERVSVGPTTWVVGRDGDRAAVGDWDCDGLATVALLRPGTGEVFVFASWARPGSEVTVTAATVVPGADGLQPSDPDGDGCPELVAARGDGPAVTVPLGASR